MDWVDLQHPASGGTQRVPDDPDVITFWEARGWARYTPEPEKPFVPVPGTEDPDDSDWVTLYHPGVGTTHQFPNNPDALAGAFDAGWEYLPDPPAPEDEDASETPVNPPADQDPEPEPSPARKTASATTVKGK